jgi:hypothetical protein
MNTINLKSGPNLIIISYLDHYIKNMLKLPRELIIYLDNCGA